jgi:hypothetical protein
VKWVDGQCQLSADLFAFVRQTIGGAWCASVGTHDGGVWVRYDNPTEDTAKDAVAHWIGKTMAQFSNALAAGEKRDYQDDGN